MIGQLVDSASVVAELVAANKDAALKELLGVAQESGAFGAKITKALHKRMVDREAMGSTGLGNGVAVPHVKSEGIDRVVLVLARTKKGLEWHAIDGRPVHVMFLLISPVDQPETHLQCLRWIATLARNSDFRRFLLDAEDAGAMRDLLREMQPKG